MLDIVKSVRYKESLGALARVFTSVVLPCMVEGCSLLGNGRLLG